MRRSPAILLLAVSSAIIAAGVVFSFVSKSEDPVRAHLDAIQALEKSWTGVESLQVWRGSHFDPPVHLAVAQLLAVSQHRAHFMNTPTEDWSVECKPSGQHGYVFYHEGARELPFYWEYGGGDMIVIVRFDEPDKFALRHPWAVERKREILERVAGELVRQQAPGGRSEIDERSLCIYVREKIAG